MKEIEHKVLPQSVGVERIVLGTIIIENNILDRVIKDFSTNLFNDPKNRTIANTIIDIYKSNKGIDLVTVVSQLKQKNEIDKAGGIKYISELSKAVYGSANLEHHIRILQEEALRRNLIKVSTNAVKKSFDESEDVFDVFNETQHELDNALKNVVNYEIKKVGQIHSTIISESIRILKSGQKSGVPSGLRMLDNVTNGWQKSDLVILAGRPGMGKTSAVVSMAIHPAVFQDIPVAIFSLEMSSEQLVSRMQSSFSEVNVSKIVKKQLTEDEIIQIERKTEKLRDAPIYIDDTPNISILELKGKVRKLVKENNVQLVVIDYLQLMRSGLKTQSRELEISEISRGLKSLAKELSIPVIALSQLSRSVEQRGGDKKPLLSDLRESGAIEQDADMVLFCYRPEYYEIENYEVGNQSFDTKGLFMLLISKHRNGELGEIPLRFIHEQTKIVNYTENNSTFVQPNTSSEEIRTFSNLKPNEQFSQMENITNNNDEDELLPF